MDPESSTASRIVIGPAVKYYGRFGLHTFTPYVRGRALPANCYHIRLHDPSGDDDVGMISVARSTRQGVIEEIQRFLRGQLSNVAVTRARLNDTEFPPSPREIERLQAGIEFWERRYRLAKQALRELEAEEPADE